MTVVTDRVRRSLEAQPGSGSTTSRSSTPPRCNRVEEIDDHQRRPVLRIAVRFVGDVRLIDNRDLFDVLTLRAGLSRRAGSPTSRSTSVEHPVSTMIITTPLKIAWATIVGPMPTQRSTPRHRTRCRPPDSTIARPMLPTPRTGSTWATPNSTPCSDDREDHRHPCCAGTTQHHASEHHLLDHGRGDHGGDRPRRRCRCGRSAGR